MLRGPSHLLLYSILTSVRYMKINNGPDSFIVQEQLISDLISAIKSCPEMLSHLSIFLQLLLIKQYEHFGMNERNKLVVDYLTGEQVLQHWHLLQKFALRHSLQLYSLTQDNEGQLIDTWSLACLEGQFSDFNQFCADCRSFFQASTRPAFLNFSLIPNKFLLCSVKFSKKSLRIDDENSAELAIYNNCCHEFIIESIGLFFNSQEFDAVVFDLDSPLAVAPFSMVKLRKSFLISKASEHPISAAFVTMQLNLPFLAVQFEHGNLLWSNNISSFSWESCASPDYFHFVAFANSVLKRHLHFSVSKIKPSLWAEFKTESKCYRAVPVPLKIAIHNNNDQPINTELNLSSDTFCVFQDRDGKVLRQSIPISIDPNGHYELPCRIKVYNDKATITAMVSFEPSCKSLMHL